MGRSWMMLAVLVAACAGRHDADIADLGAPDLAGPIEDVGPFACALSLDSYCAQNGCIRDLTSATAEATSRCADASRPTIASTATCLDDVIVSMTETDAGPDWVYDRVTGGLVAVLWHANTQSGCSGGPTVLEMRGCGGESLLCPNGP